MADIRNFIGFAANETLIKEYDGFRMFFPVKAKVSLAVTSKRLITYSMGRSFFDIRSESLYQQATLADIKGVAVVQSARARIGLVAAGIVVMFVGILAAVFGFFIKTLTPLVGGIGCCIAGIILLVLGIFLKKHLFRFEVWGDAWTLSLGEFETMKPDITGGPELLKVVEELGALIIEIQEGTLYSGAQ
ncbi:MAG TPA: hypothetical protein PKM50_08570 [Methanoregula sp.]|nr:hypothetical protein [Methanoregula sp.]